eukprot:GHVU01024093.1.p1 GENE.GHVU01024093.1~~GHVU01024093.1.p1  ORF type:complete len:252 (+),score=54.45 GHVU01024093.1:94-756(+)
MDDERKQEWDDKYFERDSDYSSEDSYEEKAIDGDDEYEVDVAAHERLDEGLKNAGIEDPILYNKYHDLLDEHRQALRTQLLPTDPPAKVPGMKVTLKPGAQPIALWPRPAGEQVNEVTNVWAMAGLEAGRQRRPRGGTSLWASPTTVVPRKGASIINQPSRKKDREPTEQARRIMADEELVDYPELFAWAQVAILESSEDEDRNKNEEPYERNDSDGTLD